MQKITPCLWYEGNAEEAVNFYTSLIKDSSIGTVTHYSEAGPGEPGSVLTITFKLYGQEFMALNGGPQFQFTPAISFIINCENQAEIDALWDGLLQGGAPDQCGWLTDKFGVSWQIVPIMLEKLMTDPNPEKVRRVTEAMLQMVKLDIAALQAAYDQA